ncbi:MAG: hypothetical protein U9P11_08170 [Pseudomonadota bacterium]|jgi:hypothetical protein|nr:hypothetical protein [Pseudomonadota bacterium]
MVTALADLLEAEGRSLREWTFRLGVSLGLVVVFSLLALAGIALLLFAAWLFLSELWGNVAAALMLSLISLMAAGITLWIATRRIK